MTSNNQLSNMSSDDICGKWQTNSHICHVMTPHLNSHICHLMTYIASGNQQSHMSCDDTASQQPHMSSDDMFSKWQSTVTYVR